MKKIGILGGTFNPIHIGHLNIARAALQEYNFDRIWLMPSGIPAHKPGVYIADKQSRFDMLSIAIKNEPLMEISDIELLREGNTYTYETLEQLGNLYKDVSFGFIIGADSLLYLKEWKHPEIISKYATIYVAGRNNEKKEKLVEYANDLHNMYGTETHFIECDEIDISSKEIRTCIKNNEISSIEEYLPEGVLDYIIKNNLYL